MNYYNLKNNKKKIIKGSTAFALFVLALSILMACHSTEKKVSKLPEQATGTITHHEDENAGTLFLNNGVKWKADSVTNRNVAALKNILATTKPAALNEYHNAAKELLLGITKMVTECKMHGPDHDALHHWLEPVMQTNKKMQQSKTINEAAELFKTLNEQLSIYPQFFD